MVLVDTSVWIRYFRNELKEAAVLRYLLQQDQVCAHPLVYGELLIGDKGGRKPMLAAYNRMRRLEMVPHEYVVEFVNLRHLNGRGIGWVDIQILASAMVGRVPVWSADLPFAAIARELGFGYDPPASAPPGLEVVRQRGRQ